MPFSRMLFVGVVSISVLLGSLELVSPGRAAVCSDDRRLRVSLAGERGEQLLQYALERSAGPDRRGSIGSAAGAKSVSESLLFELSASLAAVIANAEGIGPYLVYSLLPTMNRVQTLRKAQEAVSRLRSPSAIPTGP